MSFFHAELICYKCGTVFGMSDVVYKLRKDDHNTFWCPNGHQQCFSGKTTKDKAIDQLEVEKLRLQRDITRLESANHRLAHEYRFKCPFAHCTWGTNTKILMRKHLGDKHKMQSIAGLLPPTAGSDAHGDMGISGTETHKDVDRPRPHP